MSENDVSEDDSPTPPEGTEEPTPPPVVAPTPVFNVVEANTPMSLDQPDPLAQGPWIEYLGIATVRILTPQDWSNQGIDSDLHVQWNYLNQKRLPKSIFSEAQLRYLLNADGRFREVTDDELASEAK